MKIDVLFFMLLGFMVGCIPLPNIQNINTVAQTPKKQFFTHNFIYEDNIKTVLLYPEALTDDKQQLLKPAIIHIQQQQPLVLEFDELSESSSNFSAKIIHCNFDWTVSQLNEIEYMNEVNRFQIRNLQTSFNTKTAYTHYSFALPKVKLAGNYVLMVYKDNDEDDIILTKRFIVFENKVIIQTEIKASSSPTERDRNQQIDFNLDYKNFELVNPREQIKVIIRQNYRWDNAITYLKPNFTREGDKILEYKFFNLENNFRGANEFRKFDMRSIRFLGFNIANINISDTLVQMRLETDVSRNGGSYFRMTDLNGGFFVGHYESGRGVTEADYVKVRFSLKSSIPMQEEVYVAGAFNDWQALPENKMTFDAEKQLYTTDILLKQGEYNYQFAINNPLRRKLETGFWEGDFYNTENQYEIIVYYRPFGSRADTVIAYKSFNSIADGR